MNAFKSKHSPALGEEIVTRVRDLSTEDVKLTHFTHDDYCIYAHFVYSQELLDARMWNFDISWGDYPIKDTIADKVYVKRIDFDKRGLRSPESVKRKREAVTLAMLQHLQERSHELERDNIQRIQTRIDRYLHSVHEDIFKRVDNWLSSRDSYEKLRDDSHIKKLQREYDEAKKKADEAYKSLVYWMNVGALDEVKEVLTQLPEDMENVFVEKFKNCKYFTTKTIFNR